MFDGVTGETLMQVSIYKISYCSADAANSNVFAFVSTDDINTCKTDEQLVCYAFLCQKRKVAQKVTLTVAHSFERAYQIWQDTVQRKKFQTERMQRQQNHHLAEQQKHNKQNIDDHHIGVVGNNCSKTDLRNLLIDFNSEISDITAEICNKDHREFLQTTWVSFDDDTTTTTPGHHHQYGSSKLHEQNLWETKNLINCS